MCFDISQSYFADYCAINDFLLIDNYDYVSLSYSCVINDHRDSPASVRTTKYKMR